MMLKVRVVTEEEVRVLVERARVVVEAAARETAAVATAVVAMAMAVASTAARSVVGRMAAAQAVAGRAAAATAVAASRRIRGPQSCFRCRSRFRWAGRLPRPTARARTGTDARTSLFSSWKRVDESKEPQKASESNVTSPVAP